MPRWRRGAIDQIRSLLASRKTGDAADVKDAASSPFTVLMS
jgi:hypothetical protein